MVRFGFEPERTRFETRTHKSTFESLKSEDRAADINHYSEGKLLDLNKKLLARKLCDAMLEVIGALTQATVTGQPARGGPVKSWWCI